jgi:hypothetical protein
MPRLTSCREKPEHGLGAEVQQRIQVAPNQQTMGDPTPDSEKQSVGNPVEHGRTALVTENMCP